MDCHYSRMGLLLDSTIYSQMQGPSSDHSSLIPTTPLAHQPSFEAPKNLSDKVVTTVSLEDVARSCQETITTSIEEKKSLKKAQRNKVILIAAVIALVILTVVGVGIIGFAAAIPLIWGFSLLTLGIGAGSSLVGWGIFFGAALGAAKAGQRLRQQVKEADYLENEIKFLEKANALFAHALEKRKDPSNVNILNLDDFFKTWLKAIESQLERNRDDLAAIRRRIKELKFEMEESNRQIKKLTKRQASGTMLKESTLKALIKQHQQNMSKKLSAVKELKAQKDPLKEKIYKAHKRLNKLWNPLTDSAEIRKQFLKEIRATLMDIQHHSHFMPTLKLVYERDFKIENQQYFERITPGYAEGIKRLNEQIVKNKKKIIEEVPLAKFLISPA